MQNFIATGHLGQDVEMRYLPEGDAVANLSVAISKQWTDAKGEKRESTIWVRATVWRKLAENCAKFLHKGSKVLVSGELMPVNVYTKKDGTPGASYEMTAHSVEFLDSKPADGAPVSAAPAQRQAQPARQATVEADIPF